MRALRLTELKALLAASEFADFWRELKAARAAADEARAAYEDALTQVMVADFRAELAQKNAIDKVYAAGEAEDEAARLMAESSTLENQGLDLVGSFEDQRYQASEAWYKQNAAERLLEERREALAAAKGQSDATMAKLQAEVARLERAHEEAAEAYDREERQKVSLWGEVEADWARSTELDLRMNERKVDARRIKRMAEKLFAEAEGKKGATRGLHEAAELLSRKREQAERQVNALIESAPSRFGATVTQGFLYFRCAEAPKRAYAVALFSDGESFNIEVAELSIYRVDRERGVSFLEPAVEIPDGVDDRFEQWFLGGRKGRSGSGTAEVA